MSALSHLLAFLYKAVKCLRISSLLLEWIFKWSERKSLLAQFIFCHLHEERNSIHRSPYLRLKRPKGRRWNSGMRHFFLAVIQTDLKPLPKHSDCQVQQWIPDCIRVNSLSHIFFGPTWVSRSNEWWLSWRYYAYSLLSTTHPLQEEWVLKKILKLSSKHGNAN